MMGTSHATAGALGWLLTVPVAAGIVAAPVEGKVLIAGTIATAGAALLPDLDHPDATIARTLGPITEGISKLVHLIAGGHRQATHSILFAVLAGLATHFIAAWSPVAALIIFWSLTSLALKALHLTPPRISHNKKALFIVAEATLIAWAVNQYMPGNWWWLGIAVGLGSFLHLGPLGDCLTPEGVPFLWPWRKRFALPVIAHTGNALETRVITPIMAVATVYLIYRNIWPDLEQRLPWTH